MIIKVKDFVFIGIDGGIGIVGNIIGGIIKKKLFSGVFFISVVGLFWFYMISDRNNFINLFKIIYNDINLLFIK